MSNLLERLHASFFFYLMASPTQFLQIGQYLPPAIILSIAITVTGLAAWNTAGYTEFDPQDAARQAQEAASQLQEKLGHGEKAAVVTAVTAATFKPGKRKRPVMPILTVMFGAHVVGLLVLASLRVPAVVANLNVSPTICSDLRMAYHLPTGYLPPASCSICRSRTHRSQVVIFFSLRPPCTDQPRSIRLHPPRSWHVHLPFRGPQLRSRLHSRRHPRTTARRS